ncbi:hypothetical protein MTO96_000698 [Rhipicephalus appendiculatus]
MEQPNEASASPPSSAVASPPLMPAQELGKTKGNKSGHHTPHSPRRKLHRGIRSTNSTDVSPARSPSHSSHSRSPALSGSGSPAATNRASREAANTSGASPSPRPTFKKDHAKQEPKAVSSPSRSRSPSPTVGQSGAAPSTAERMPRTLQSSPRPLKIGPRGSRPIIAPPDHKATLTAKGSDPESILPKDSSGTPATLLKPELIVGCVSCLVLVFLLVYAVTNLAMASSTSTVNLCVTQACRAYSRRLSSSINRSVNPCVHFTHFVCDGWQRRQDLDVWEERFLLFMNQLHTTLYSIHVPTEGQNDEQRAAALYRSCYNVFQGQSDELASVKEALASAGIIWPQQSKGADALFTMLYSSLKLGWDAVLRFRVVQGPGEPAEELFVSQGRSFDTLQDWYKQGRATTVQHAYFEFIRSQFADNDNSPTFGNEKPCSESTSAWPDSLRIFSDDRAFLQTLLALWENYGEDQFHLFVSWCTVQVAALYANRGLILNYYGKVPDRAMLYYRAFCVSKALFFSPSLIAKYSRNDFHSKAGAVAKEMVLSIRLAFSRRLYKWPHYNPNVIVVANWNSLDSAFREFEYDEGGTGHRESNGVPDMTYSFVANWRHSVLLNYTRQVDELSYAVRHLWLHSPYWGEQDFHLMPYTLSFPFFDSELPTSINFGGFGSEVVDALGSIFVGSYRVYSNATDSLFKCLMRGPSGEEEYPEDDVSSAIGYSALVDAFRQAPRTTWVLEGLEKYSDLQLLFISSCFVLCPGSQRGQDNECDIFAQHVHEFSDAFQCTPEAVGVNSSEHCQPL